MSNNQHNTDETSPKNAACEVVDFTDVVDALVAPLPPTSHLRPLTAEDHSLPDRDSIVVMEDFAGELRRWLANERR